MPVVMRVRTVWAGVAGTPYYSNHYFGDDTVPATAQDAVNAVDAFWFGLSGNISNDLTWTVEGTVARIEATDGSLVGQYAVTPETGVGGSSGQMLPLATQGIVRWLTDTVIAGRMLRGRTFVPGLVEDVNDADGKPVSALPTLLTTVGQALINDTGNTLQVWSRTHGNFAEVETAQGWNQWATLRSRRD